MLISEAYHSALHRLCQADIPDAAVEVAAMLGHLLGVDRAGLVLAASQPLSSQEVDLLEQWLSRRLQREPLAYILGEKEFWSRRFKVSRDVLIPRPETEFLLELVLQTVHPGQGDRDIIAVDLGVGSGVVTVVLALEIPGVMVYGVDRSSAALSVARENVVAHGVEDLVRLVNGDWCGPFRPDQEFDLVVSNPPYVAADLLARPCGIGPQSLQREVGEHEPRLALDGGPKGLASIQTIAVDLHRYLRPGGWAFMEIGADQGEAVTNLFQGMPYYTAVTVHRDYAGLPRILQARRTAKI